ncbi:UNVERIFIED_ORG: ABC-type sugar transport system ATPase subunit [Ensifer adhaerens]|nr:ABC-type sugar transport system ATPase subunit [Ensifer adhaerens]
MRAVGTGAALAKRGLAMVFPPYALHPHMSMRNNIAISVENGEDGSGCD